MQLQRKRPRLTMNSAPQTQQQQPQGSGEVAAIELEAAAEDIVEVTEAPEESASDG